MCKGPEVGSELSQFLEQEEKSMWLEHRRPGGSGDEARGIGTGQASGSLGDWGKEFGLYSSEHGKPKAGFSARKLTLAAVRRGDRGF